MAPKLINAYFDTIRVETLQALLYHYGVEEFASPRRSTVPLLSLVKDGWIEFAETLSFCQLPRTRTCSSYRH